MVQGCDRAWIIVLWHGIAPKRYMKHSPWITKGLVNSSIRNSKLLKQKLQNPSIENSNRYYDYNKLYRLLLRIAKRNYYTDQLKEAKHDIKQTWCVLKRALNKTTTENNLPDFFLVKSEKYMKKRVL